MFVGTGCSPLCKSVSAQQTRQRHELGRKCSLVESRVRHNGDAGGVRGLRRRSCEPYLDNLATLSNAKTYYVSFPLDPSTSVSWAQQYSTLSLSHKEMGEIGFDDFVGRIEDDQIAGTMPNPASFVADVLAATKSENPNLAFGVTIYEDSLTIRH